MDCGLMLYRLFNFFDRSKVQNTNHHNNANPNNIKSKQIKIKTTGIWDADAANEAFKLRAGAPCQQVKFYLLQIFI